jgi:hypothetical protein
VGTLLLRIKQSPEVQMTANDGVVNYQEASYFDGKKRKFQVVVKGRFKSPLPMSHCVTGQAFDRPAGKLPARFIVSTCIRFFSTLAPQLEISLEGDKPRFLSPLVATAHTVLVNTSSSDGGRIRHDIESPVEEGPSTKETSVLYYVPGDLTVPDTTNSSVSSRMKVRKKIFNTLAAKQSAEPRFDTTKEYTFEFYQHLLDFGEKLAIDMGKVVGKIGLAQATDGQPLKILAAYKSKENHELEALWSFDIWHESLFHFAEQSQIRV